MITRYDTYQSTINEHIADGISVAVLDDGSYTTGKNYLILPVLMVKNDILHITIVVPFVVTVSSVVPLFPSYRHTGTEIYDVK